LRLACTRTVAAIVRIRAISFADNLALGLAATLVDRAVLEACAIARN
jgi:hypothetical protein